MNQGQNDSKRLSPRQIINRYRKGEYVDESIEAISSAVSSCSLSFDCNAVPFPTGIIEKVYENIALSKAMYERQKQGQSIEDIGVPDYPQLREILKDLSYPPLWESMQDKITDVSFMEIIMGMGFYSKYRLDTGETSCYNVTSVVSHLYDNAVIQAGLSTATFQLCLNMMIRKGCENEERRLHL